LETTCPNCRYAIAKTVGVEILRPRNEKSPYKRSTALVLRVAFCNGPDHLPNSGYEITDPENTSCEGFKSRRP